MKLVIYFLVLMTVPILGGAKEASPIIADPVLEKRVMALSVELRCLVCQGQSLADSHSDFARDMRRKIQDLMEQGMSDREVVDFLVLRYSDFIRFRPPMKGSTLLLWFGPAILVVLGMIILYVNLIKRRKLLDEGASSLSPADHQRAQQLLNDKAENSQA